MKIFVNTGVLLHHNAEYFRCFLLEVLEIIVNRNREHQFIILTEDAEAKKLWDCSNVIKVVKRFTFRHPILVKIWYDLKVTSILKKNQADVFVSFDGLGLRTTRIPQCILLSDHFALTSRGSKQHLFFYKNIMHKIVQRASVLVCWSDFKKKDLMLRYDVSEKKLNVVYPAAKEIFQPLNEQVKEGVRKKHCNEKNYFIYTGTVPQGKDLLNLLKAFSVFKRRQKSDWKLVLASDLQQHDKKFLSDLRTYKYRGDVVMATDENPEDAARLIGSAYALICSAYSDGSVFPILQAFKCQVPVITADTPTGREIAGDAALYVNPGDYENIADQMMLLYKDESLRKTLIENGKMKGSGYSLDKSAERLWQCICRTGADYKPGDLN